MSTYISLFGFLLESGPKYICALKKEGQKKKVNEKAVLKQEKLKAKLKASRKLTCIYTVFPISQMSMILKEFKLWQWGELIYKYRYNKRKWLDSILNTTNRGLIQKLMLGNS